MPDELRVSVIIPVYNGAATLPAGLRALQRQTRPPDEVIVVNLSGRGDKDMSTYIKTSNLDL